MVLADGGYAVNEWAGPAAAAVLVFVLVAGLVAVVLRLYQGGQGSWKAILANPAVPVTAVVMTVCFELIVHR